jgi:hypothetical protein
MDTNFITSVYIAKNCARTNGTDATIDGDTVTGCQINAPLKDNGAAAATYYGAGELVVTDASNKVLTAGTILSKSLEEIKFAQRSYNGLNFYGSHPAIAGKNITSYVITPYKAAVEQVSIVHTIDATLLDTTYILKIRSVETNTMTTNLDKCVQSVMFKSAVAGSTAAQIATGLVTEINYNFNNHPTMPLEAVELSDGIGMNSIKITARPKEFIPGVFPYEKVRFTVELINFTATTVDNIGADLVYNGITYYMATPGAGTYEQVAQMEWQAKMETGANKEKVNPGFRKPEVALDTQQYEDDGTTINRYDLITVNWTNTQGDFSQNVRQTGSVVIALPKDNNTTNQQTDIKDCLNKYIYTIWGVPAIGPATGGGNSGTSSSIIVLA